MRKVTVLIALFVGLSGHGLAWGQSSGFKTINPKDITYTPVDIGKNLAAPIPMPPQSSQPGFFKRMWSHMPTFLGGSKPVMPQVTPAPAMHTKN